MAPEDERARGLLLLSASVLLLGGSWPLTKVALLHGATPIWFAWGRVALSGTAAFALVGALGRLVWPKRADLPAMGAIGLLQLAAFFALSHEAAGWLPAGRSGILANTTTIWIVPLSLLLLHEPIPPRRWAAAGLGLAGVAVLSGPWAIDWTAGPVLVGHVLLLGAALSFALAIVLVRRFPPRVSMLALLPWCFALATAALLPVALLHAPRGGIGASPVAWAMLGAIGLAAGPLGTWCVIRAQASLPAMLASIGFLASPAVGLLASALWLGEALTPSLLGGAALILCGVALAAWPRRRQA